MSRKNDDDALLKELRAFGLAYPGTHLKSPWPGHKDLAVKDKTFAYLSVEGEPFSISCKLPQSSSAALMLPFTKPTAYGLGKSGWVTANFSAGEILPVELLKAWIDESYRAQAPKRLVASLATQRAGESESAMTSARRSATKAATTRRPPRAGRRAISNLRSGR
jgi:predicted DNA-binding protein (MmcQ/YjbR family)